MTIIRLIGFVFIAAALCSGSVQPASAQAYGAQQMSDIPLVVIRFNQQRVYYSKQLYNAISRAVAIKPDVMISVVSFVPNIGSESQREKMHALAGQQRGRLLQDLRKMGIPNAHINVTTEHVSDARYHELYIYVD